MEYRVYPQGVREVELVRDCRDLLNNLVGAQEAMLQLLGWSLSLRSEVDVIGGEQHLVTYLELNISSRFVSVSFLIGFGQHESVSGNLGGVHEAF